MSTYGLLENITGPVMLKKVMAGGELGGEWFALERGEDGGYMLKENGNVWPLEEAKFEQVRAFLLSEDYDMDAALAHFADVAPIGCYLAAVVYLEMSQHYGLHTLDVEANVCAGWKGEYLESLLGGKGDLYFDTYSKRVVLHCAPACAPELNIYANIVLPLGLGIPHHVIVEHIGVWCYNAGESLRQFCATHWRPALARKKQATGDDAVIWCPLTITLEEEGGHVIVAQIDVTDAELCLMAEDFEYLMEMVLESGTRDCSIGRGEDGEWVLYDEEEQTEFRFDEGEALE